MKLLITITLILILTLVIFAQTATVISENPNLRVTPNQQGKVIETISNGTSVEVIKQTSGWFLVQSTEFVG